MLREACACVLFSLSTHYHVSFCKHIHVEMVVYHAIAMAHTTRTQTDNGRATKRGCFLGIQTLQVCETLHFTYRKISSSSNLVSCDNERKKEMKLGKGKKERNKAKPDKSGPSQNFQTFCLSLLI